MEYLDVSSVEGAMDVAKPRLLFLVNEDWYFWSHRLDLARATRDAGWEVLVASRVGSCRQRIENEGFTFLPIRLKRRSWNPLREFAALIELVSYYRRKRPNIVHHVAMKPVLYGSLAARLACVSGVVNAFGGLGYLFTADGWRVKLLRMVVMRALRFVFRLTDARVIFQNDEDCQQLVDAGVVRRTHAIIIRGAGVDLSKFTPCPEKDGTPMVVLASRMLWDKGIGEFIEAARLLKEQGHHATCVLVGRVDEENQRSISSAQLFAWQEEGIVSWWGHRDDMPHVFGLAHIVVLPTYYGEGVPKVLLEAAACGKPIVATQMRGCRDIVRNGDNGFLVPPRDASALAQAITTLLRNPSLRQQMGNYGRRLVEEKFSSERVANETLALYHELLGNLHVSVQSTNLS